MYKRQEYGGWKKKKLAEGTGFFTRCKEDGRWWLVDPLGYAFFSVGPDCVVARSDCRVDGVEKWMDWLPDREDPVYGRMYEPVSYTHLSGRYMMQTAGKAKNQLTGRQKKKIRLVLLLLPFMIFVLIFNYAPLLGWSYAFVDFKPGVSVFDSEFVGLKYFQKIVANPKDFLNVMRNTLCISFLNICCSVLPAIFAIAISQLKNKRYAKMVQTGTSIPNFISWVLVYSIVFMLLSSESSALNNILMGLGLVKEPVNPLTNAKHAWFIQVAIGAWKTLGYNAIIYLSAITSIDQELYQAADVDGANTWQKIVHVTVPGLLSTFFVLLLLAISNMLSNGFDQYWLLGNGMTWDKLEVFDTYVYRMGIKNMEYSLATAMGIFKSVVSIILLSFANWASKRLRGDSIF